ncbi:MAG TPA: PQQ-dependent sugar dehydrogenase, partial [Micromonosporaceae bacterium]
VQGFAWDAQQRMFATESDQQSWDEVNAIRPGRNYGWPVAEGTSPREELADPIQQFPADRSGCAGLAVAGDTMITSCLASARLWLLRLTDRGAVQGPPTAALVDAFGRLRAAVLAPDGSVWVTTSNRDGEATPRAGDDKIIRIVAAGGGVGIT